MITCCNGCVAPKRHIGCHATCQDYIDQKAADAKRKEKELGEKQMIGHKCDSYERYIKHRSNRR